MQNRSKVVRGGWGAHSSLDSLGVLSQKRQAKNQGYGRALQAIQAKACRAVLLMGRLAGLW